MKISYIFLLLLLSFCYTNHSKQEVSARNNFTAYEQTKQDNKDQLIIRNHLFAGLFFPLNEKLIYVTQDSSKTISVGDTLITFIKDSPVKYEVIEMGGCNNLIETTGGFADCVLHPEGAVAKLVNEHSIHTTDSCHFMFHSGGDSRNIVFLLKDKAHYQLVCSEEELINVISKIDEGYQEVENSDMQLDIFHKQAILLNEEPEKDINIDIEGCYEIDKKFYFLISFSLNEYTFSYILFYDGKSLKKIYEYPIA